MIKLDLPFPKNCEDCPFSMQLHVYSKNFTTRVCVVTKTTVDTYYYKRAKICPLKK